MKLVLMFMLKSDKLGKTIQASLTQEHRFNNWLKILAKQTSRVEKKKNDILLASWVTHRDITLEKSICLIFYCNRVKKKRSIRKQKNRQNLTAYGHKNPYQTRNRTSLTFKRILEKKKR